MVLLPLPHQSVRCAQVRDDKDLLDQIDAAVRSITGAKGVHDAEIDRAIKQGALILISAVRSAAKLLFKMMASRLRRSAPRHG